MKPWNSLRTAALASLLSLLPAVAHAADYAGNYQGEKISVLISPEGPAFAGEIHMGDQKFPLKAHPDGDHLSGTFNVGASAFPFTATAHGDDLTFITDGVTYQLHRHANPLAAGPTSKPITPADALAGYTILNETEFGIALAHELPTVTTTRAALQATFPDLARNFGARPTILGAYEDAREHKSAFVSFTTNFNDRPVKGFVTAKLRDQGAVVFVVFGNADATRAQWSALTAKPEPGPEHERDMKSEMAAVPLTPYSFPDHTGAIGLAEGYTTKAPTESNLTVTGPADQKIRMAFGGTYYTPDAGIVRQNPQNVAKLNLAISPYSDDPATALANIIRANSVVSQRNGGPTIVPERVIKVVPVQARNPGGKGSQITYDITITEKGVAKHYRSLIQFEISPLRNGSWGFYASLQVLAPPDTFEHDLPVMLAQVFSLSENEEAVKAKSQREMAAAKQLADAQAAANAKIAQAHYDHNKSVAEASARQSKAWEDADRNEKIKQRTATDFIETIRGERTVEDTVTGEKTSVNLADVHDIVDKANYQNPGRFREIPLRDEVYPMAGRENEPDYLPR